MNSFTVPTTPPPSRHELITTQDLWQGLLVALRERGHQGRRESGAFLLGHRTDSHSRISEYVLYGLYVTRVSKEAAAQQYSDPVDRTLCYWDTKPMNEADLQRFKDRLAEPKLAAMISAKSKTDVRTMRKVFGY